MFTRKFWIDTAERAIKTFAQALLVTGVFDTASQDLSTSVETKLVAALMMAGASVLTSLVSSGFGQRNSASVVDAKGDDGHADPGGIIVMAAVAVLVWLIMWYIIIK